MIRDLSGRKFGRLLVTNTVGVKNKKRQWECHCECGTVTIVATCNLMNGHTQSCGCLMKERTIESSTTHGHASRLNGESREYIAWLSMKARCNNPKQKNYKDYGGRGITVCDRWTKSFDLFLLDMGQCPCGYQIERVDNSKGYSPKNCKWASRIEQARNKRNNRVFECNGKRKSLSEWCMALGMDHSSILGRLKRGWSIEKALTTPPRGRTCP